MPILPGLLAPVAGPPASQFLIYYSATTATVLARIFPPFESGLLLLFPLLARFLGKIAVIAGGEERSDRFNK